MKLCGLSKRFGKKQVLDSFSLELPETGVVALLGPSGCGKTTLLRVLAGLERPDEGSAELPGDCKVSMVFQEDRLLPALSALDNVRAPLAAADGALAEACLAGCGLADAMDEYPGALSGGMRRRVAIARAVAFRGDLLLLDEAFKGLDPQRKREVMTFVLRGPYRPRLCLMVTHDLEEALDWADQILVARGLPMAISGCFAAGDPSRKRQNRTQILSLLTADGVDLDMSWPSDGKDG